MYTNICRKLWLGIENLKQDARGVSAIEYAILAALIIGAVAAAVSALNLEDIFGTIGNKVKDVVNS